MHGNVTAIYEEQRSKLHTSLIGVGHADAFSIYLYMSIVTCNQPTLWLKIYTAGDSIHCTLVLCSRMALSLPAANNRKTHGQQHKFKFVVYLTKIGRFRYCI
jgi:hypothetical protein